MSTNNMDNRTLSKLSKAELIQMLLKQDIERNKLLQKQKPTPVPRKSVKKMVQDYEENIISPPTPKPRTKTIAFQVRLSAKRQQFSHTIIWKAKFTINSVDFNPQKGQALGRINNFCPVDGKAKGLQ